jgi:hypothetical protein
MRRNRRRHVCPLVDGKRDHPPVSCNAVWTGSDGGCAAVSVTSAMSREPSSTVAHRGRFAAHEDYVGLCGAGGGELARRNARNKREKGIRAGHRCGETKLSGDRGRMWNEAERETKWSEGRERADNVERARSGSRDRAAEATG